MEQELDNLRILLTGSSGLLGSEIVRYFENTSPHKVGIVTLDRVVLAAGSLTAISELLTRHRINVVIHAAANTDVEGCEINPEIAQRDNVTMTGTLLEAVAATNATFVYISSTGIYGTAKQDPYTERDEPHPTTAHHRTKYEAEKLVAAYLNHLVIRTGWLFGGAPGQKKNFVWNRFLEAQGKQVIQSDQGQRGNPTYVRDVCRQLEILLEHNCSGVFNCVGEGTASRFEYVSEIVRLLGLPCKVEAVQSTSFARKAPVSNNESALNYNLQQRGLNRMRPWRESLSAYIKILEPMISQVQS